MKRTFGKSSEYSNMLILLILIAEKLARIIYLKEIDIR